MPQYQRNVRFIAAALEEKEREEFAKLKKVKAKIESRKSW
ncbi:MAG: V-type ATP synthase subunit D [Nitrosopumilus sp.]